ncbi:glycosyltransferase family 2 protein [Jannaschia marina]|uniref:glycosyltransferase family 2 protein n=1 Tax=Jannaschia marina TaxID=2741674 RepID=UPI0015CC08A6|nr:glycosyltransferase family 2 protein [Jannaschia marina]
MPPTPRITVVTCLRDEGPFIVEWVAHLRALGVGTILAYTNDCRDGTEALLKALAPAGVVHVPLGDIRAAGGRSPQWRAMRAAWDAPACAGAEWLLHLDTDEFIALDGPADLPGLIAANSGADAIVLPWRLFGCAGRLTPGEGATPARFDRAAPPGLAYPALGSFFKTLFRRAGPFTGFGIHRPRQSAPPVLHDDCGRPAPELAAAAQRILLWRGGTVPEGRMVQLNHYSTRSVHEFLVKTGRGLPNHVGKPVGLEYWVERNFNETRCTMIAPQLPAFETEATRLRGLPGVATAEAGARGWHAEALRAILATREGARLCGRLVLASGSRAPAPELGRDLLTLYARAEEAAR